MKDGSQFFHEPHQKRLVKKIDKIQRNVISFQVVITEIKVQVSYHFYMISSKCVFLW